MQDLTTEVERAREAENRDVLDIFKRTAGGRNVSFWDTTTTTIVGFTSQRFHQPMVALGLYYINCSFIYCLTLFDSKRSHAVDGRNL